MEPQIMHEHGRKHKHGHDHDTATYWASWCSPVGLGFFLVAATVALVVFLHALAAVAFGVMNMAHRDRDGEWNGRMERPLTMPAGQPAPSGLMPSATKMMP